MVATYSGGAVKGVLIVAYDMKQETFTCTQLPSTIEKWQMGAALHKILHDYRVSATAIE